MVVVYRYLTCRIWERDGQTSGRIGPACQYGCHCRTAHHAGQIAQDTKAILSQTKEIAWNTKCTAYFSEVTAKNTEAIKIISLINGAVRNSENEHMVKLLRQKSQLVVAYGTCAMFGGTPALANLTAGAQDILDYVYTKTPTSADFQQTYHPGAPVIPQTEISVPEGTLTLPKLYDTVKALDQVIDVDYYVPGCPPTQETLGALLDAVVGFVYNGTPLPPKGTTIGVTKTTMCEECPRHKENRRITEIKDPYQVDVDPDLCLMDQGILCLGAATVGGCGAKCTRVGQPCRGCYGPTEIVSEQGASIFTAVASLFPVLEEDPTCKEDKIIDIMSSVKDPLGYFYAFTMSKALIKRAVKEGGQ